MKANEFDKKFDEGDDILDALDLSKAKRIYGVLLALIHLVVLTKRQ